MEGVAIEAFQNSYPLILHVPTTKIIVNEKKLTNLNNLTGYAE